MLTDEQLTEALDLIDSRYQKVNQKYLRKVGETINKIGELNQSSINRLIQMRRMGVDVRTINRELRKVTGLTKKDIKTLYKKAAKEENTDARFSYVSKGVEPDSIRWEALVEDIWMQTAGTMENLANSTVVADNYRVAVDEAIQAVTMGVTDYNSTIRDTIKQLGSAGMQVEYASGAKKRLDSAVRMNILDGVRQVQQQAQKLIGEEVGADGVEITAHQNSAPDHEPVQGRRFTLDNFDLMQAGRPFEDEDGKQYKAFSRPITQWHCRHLVHYVILSISKRTYTDEQLKQWEEDNHQGCQIDGQHYTRYQATQLMRKLELKIRKQKDTAILAKASGDTALRRECQSNITALTKKYKSVAEQAGLKMRFDKTRVEGYRETSEDRKYQKELEIRENYGKMASEIKQSGLLPKNAVVNIPPRQIETEKLIFDDAHINAERGHNVTREMAAAWIKDSKMSATVWKRTYERYYSENGTVYVDLQNSKIRTAFSAKEYDAKTKAIMEVLKKYGY